jgi:very-short-patch-repair endonuclease
MPVKNIIPGQKVTKEKLQRAKELRREMTPAEKLLWNELRANKLGVHFRRQQVIAGFIVDFYCHKVGLVVEVDGIFTIYNKKKMPGGKRLCLSWD